MKLSSRGFDAAGMTTGRLYKQHVLGRMRPLWYSSIGLKSKHILALAVRHHLGYPIAYLTTRYEPQWHKILSGWRRLYAKLKPTEG